ncbi:hypothetical protein KUTeg_006615 [Tegillarca granosa]|uniref:Uncharacterized protein n=1 Tax=Tegillarca granosa TaxID=220873 RepID=A0ABQ9FAU5_TEGGR|nr:hypothetical protein KUTeg_006615 [Tegillarca granosa]
MIPWVEHARYSPKCLFVLEKNGHEFIANIQAEWRQVYCPKHSEFEELDARIRSFKNCPSSIKQKTEQLASAGFYYTEAESRKNAETPVDSIDSKATEKLLKMSVSGQKVIDAINEHTRKTGFRIFTIEELLNIILRSDANPDPESNFTITTERANMEPQGRNLSEQSFLMLKS